MGIIASSVSFMLLISILVAVHELGHLIVARKNGVFVEAFSIGYGTVLYEKIDKLGTKWRFSLIPIGGYVKMLGDADATSVREKTPDNISEEDMQKKSIHRKKPWQKLIVAIAGPIANFIFAIAIIFSLTLIKGIPTYTNVVKPVSEETLSYTSGIRIGDKITQANGKKIETFEDLKESIKQSTGKILNLEIDREGTIYKIDIKMYKDDMSPIMTLGISPAEIVYKRTTPIKAFIDACTTTYIIAYENIKGILQMIIGKRSIKDVGGVISIFKLSSDSAESGIATFTWTMALLSIILGAINLLPIPVLDGGTVFISSIECLIRRPLNKKFVEVVFTIGLIVVAALMLVGIWNDLVKLNCFKWLLSVIHI